MLRRGYRWAGGSGGFGTTRLPGGLVLEWSGRDAIVSDAGERLIGRGVFFRDADDRAFAWDSRRLREDFGVHTFKVAGVSHRADALPLDRFDVGRRLRLVPEPENRFDPDAIAVYDADARHQVGYVPRDETRRIRSALGPDRDDAVVFHEWRDADTETRCGLRALVAPEPVLAAIVALARSRA